MSVIRIVVSWSPSVILRVNALFFNGDEGFFMPQKGQLSTEPEINFRQFGQRSEFLLLEEAIIHWCVVRHPVSKIVIFPKLYLSK